MQAARLASQCVHVLATPPLSGQYVPALCVAKQLPLISYKLVDDDR